MRSLRCDGGAAAVEFALVAPALFMLVFGIIDIARVYSMKSRLTSAVREGARYASVQADPVASAQAVRNVVKAAAIPIGSAALTDAQISVALNSATKRVTVSVASYSLRFITPFASTIGRSAVTMSASSVLPWERGS